MSSKQERALTTSTSRGPNNAALDHADIVIIGNGIAGLTAAMEARTLAPDKRIVVITNQTHPTINTPALKQFATGKLNREQLLAFPAGTERANRIHIVTANVEEIHPHSKYVTLSGKQGFGYQSLLIATGSEPQGLSESIPGRYFDGVLSLHRLQDYMNLRRRLSETSEAVVVGGGVHAIETVMGLRYWGIQVHWLIRGTTFMRNILDSAASDMVLEHIRSAGIQIHTETEIAGIVGRIGVVAGIITNQQEMIPCQLVLSCIGTQPATRLANHSTIPLKHKNGIIVDDKLRSSVRDIYAAGDVAALRNPQTGKFETRATWYAAIFQGRIVGAMLAERGDLALQPFGVPWHATHLGELSMLTVGEPLREGARIDTLTDSSQGGYRRLTIVNDQLIGYLSIGYKQPDDSLAIKRIIDEELPIRSITKALLKGRFDAREYVSKVRSRAAEGMLTTRQLPPLAQKQPVAAELMPVAVIEEGTGRPNTDEMRPVPEAVPEPEIGLVEAEFNPFTGTLPSLVNSVVESYAPEPSARAEFFEELNPFTGNLPVVSQQNISSAAASARQEAARQINPKGLWSYSAKVPAVQRVQRPEPENTDNDTVKRKPSGSLWSYTPQNPIARGEGKR